MTITLGYWDIRGRAEPIRYLLKYLNIDFKEVRYTHAKNDWPEVKHKLGLDFPNIPYYIDDDLKLTQSMTIMQHLGRKHGLNGQTESEKIRIDIIENQIEDFIWKGLGLVVYGHLFDPNLDLETAKADYMLKIDSLLTEMSDFLGTHEWMSGKGLSYIDFFVYEVLDWNRLFKTDCLNSYNNLMDFMNRFESLPQINKYINSEQFNKLPIFAPFGRFGNSAQ